MTQRATTSGGRNGIIRRIVSAWRQSFDPKICSEKEAKIFVPFFEDEILRTKLRVRAYVLYVLLIYTIKPCNFCHKHFLVRLSLSEKLAGPFHRAISMSQGWTVLRERCHFKKRILSLQTPRLFMRIYLSSNLSRNKKVFFAPKDPTI